MDVNTLEVELTNDYTYDSKDDDDDDDDDDPVVIPDEDTPTTDLPDEETPTTDLPDEQTPTTEQPTTDLPDEETPMAEAPKTGDNSTAWILLPAFPAWHWSGWPLPAKSAAIMSIRPNKRPDPSPAARTS